MTDVCACLLCAMKDLWQTANMNSDGFISTNLYFLPRFYKGQIRKEHDKYLFCWQNIAGSEPTSS